MHSDTNNYTIINSLNNVLSNIHYTLSRYNEQLYIRISNNQLLVVLSLLKNNSDLRFNVLSDCFAINNNDQYQSIYYQLLSHELNQRVFIYTKLNSYETQSIVSIFYNANWYEREIYDMYGIKFLGHPNLKRLFNSEEYQDFPMRRSHK